MSVSTLTTGTILDQILERTAKDVVARKQQVSVTELEAMAADRSPAASLHEALGRSTPSVIAEIKRGSPSKGVFPVSVDPPEIARSYMAGGAAALSVLTDEPFFGGSLADMLAVSRVAHAAHPPVPVLRKDFIVEEYQLVEARAHGADAVLLIVAALEQKRLQALHTGATSLGLDVLVEVHDEAEMVRALDLGAAVIGVNNRDLRTFKVNLAITERLARLIPSGVVLVSESGIGSRADVDRVTRAGAHAVLVGESLILSDDRAGAVAVLLSEDVG